MANIFENLSKQTDIIKNEEALDFDFVPKKLLHREGQVEEIANSIKPMFQNQKGTNLFITGSPGIGKTASLRWVLRELSEHTDDIVPLYVNCWNSRTKYFVLLDMANQLKLTFTAGKSAEHLLQQIEYVLKGKNAVFVFDEIDKIEDNDFLYQIVEKFPRSTIFLVSNLMDYLANMDMRIKSRMTIRNLHFKEYSINEVTDIIKERIKLALKNNAIEPVLVKQIANVAYSKKDVRTGLFLLRESARSAENKSRGQITEEDIKPIIAQLATTKLGDEDTLTKDERVILECIKENNGKFSGEIFEAYVKKGGTLSYRSYKRYLERFERLSIIKTEESGAGFKGKSTKISLA